MTPREVGMVDEPSIGELRNRLHVPPIVMELPDVVPTTDDPFSRPQIDIHTVPGTGLIRSAAIRIEIPATVLDIVLHVRAGEVTVVMRAFDQVAIGNAILDTGDRLIVVAGVENAHVPVEHVPAVVVEELAHPVRAREIPHPRLQPQPLPEGGQIDGVK